jgi:hypothetical protein
VNIRYLFLRLIRRLTPESAARFLLKRRWLIRPGLESSDPVAAANRYIETLSKHGRSIEGQRVLIFGYGGRFAVGVELLKRGAAHVILCDHFVLLDEERNIRLLPAYSEYLAVKGKSVKPNPKFVTLLHGDIMNPLLRSQLARVDYVLSTSVFEHLHDVDGITNALVKLTKADGAHLHFIDLRDHYFKYPFEMLTYSNWVWKSFLNPTSNLNRFRPLDYRGFFESYFNRVEIQALERLEDEFLKVRARIRPEFLSGDISLDSVTQIQVFAEKPNPLE